MVSFTLRKVFYGAATGAQVVLKKDRETHFKLNDLEKQIILAKNLVGEISKKKVCDPATLIRVEGRLKRIENDIRRKRRLLINTYQPELRPVRMK
jgi:hypothetical protein